MQRRRGPESTCRATGRRPRHGPAAACRGGPAGHQQSVWLLMAEPPKELEIRGDIQIVRSPLPAPGLYVHRMDSGLMNGADGQPGCVGLSSLPGAAMSPTVGPELSQCPLPSPLARGAGSAQQVWAPGPGPGQGSRRWDSSLWLLHKSIEVAPCHPQGM